MNCERAEQLLPLHAGGDLEDARERRALDAHLAACDACRRSAREWAETVRLLRLDEPPRFDAAFFDPVRREVMREIRATPPPAPALATLFARLLRPQPLAYAASLALVCAALLFAARLPRAPQPSKLTGDGVAASLNKQPSPVRTKPKPTPEHVFAHDGVRRKTKALEAQARRDPAAPHTTAEARPSSNAKTPRVKEDESSSPSAARAVSPVQSPPDAASAPSPGLPGASVELAVVRDEREMLKIDLRTSDPDVRIIWFSPQPNEQTSPRRLTDKR